MSIGSRVDLIGGVRHGRGLLRPCACRGPCRRLRQARIAGVLYFVLALIAPIGLMYVPNTLVVVGDAAATAANIRASEWLLRVGIASELIHQALAVFLVLALYRLFKPVGEELASLVVILGALVSVPSVFASAVNEVAALVLCYFEYSNVTTNFPLS